MSLPQSIHPAELTGDHIGALVRWEDGDVIHQGHLRYVEHGPHIASPNPTGIVVSKLTSPPEMGTRFIIDTATVAVEASWVDARIEIREA